MKQKGDYLDNQEIVGGDRVEAERNSFYERLPLPFLSLGVSGRIIRVNQLFIDLLRYSREDVIGTFFAQYIHWDDKEFFNEQIANLIHVRSVSNLEIHMQTREGDSLFIILDGTVTADEEGKLRQTDCILHNVTERRKQEAVHHGSRDIWSRTFDAIQDIVTIQDQDLNIVRANKAAHRFFKMNSGELTGRNCHEIFTGKSEPCPGCPLLDTLEHGSPHSAVIRHENLNKTFRVSSSFIPSEKDGEGYLVHVATDITKNVESEIIYRESEERFSKAFQSNPAPMVISEIDSGLFIDVNQQWLNMLGYSREEIIGKTSEQIGLWEDSDVRDNLINELRLRNSFKEKPVQFRTKFGQIRLAHWSAEVISIDGRNMMLSLIHDITEREAALKSLKESEEKFALAFEASPDSININRLADGLYVHVNKGFTDLTGFTWEDVAGKTSREINIWYDPADRLRMVEELKSNGFCLNLEAKFRKKDRGISIGLMSARVISLNTVPHIISITRDISQIKLAEQKIIEQQLLFESMFNAITDGVVITDINRKIILVNKGMKNTFGYSPEDLLGATTKQLYADFEAFKAAGKAVFDAGSVQIDKRYVAAYRHKSGREFQGETLGVRLYDQKNRWIGNLGIMRDISQQLEAEAERERLVAAIEQTSDAITITDPKGCIQYVNPAFEKVTGYSLSELLGENPRILKSGEQDDSFYTSLWQTITAGKTFQGRMVNKRKDGELFTEEATISPVCDADGELVNFVSVKRDITRQLSLEAQFYQAQKMEAVGRLTGGVAHDFNNILSVIIGYSELAIEQTDPEKSLHENLKKIRDAAGRSADLVRQLLAFSRQQPIAPKVISLNPSIEGMLKMLTRLIGEDIDLLWVPGQELQRIRIDPTQVDQILANLCVNAKDAIMHSGRITIETAMVTFDNAYCSAHVGFIPGSFVQLSVSDNGIGFDKETAKKIFEPFFSTKELGLGTGLGLSTVYGIVKQNDGFINVYSEPGVGTTFKLYFPVCDEEQPVVVNQSVQYPVEGKGETILLVEDESGILEMTREILERLGYNLLVAGSPGQSLELLEKYSEAIDLLLTDVVLPEMNGKELAHQIQKRHPDLKVLFMSGYTANVIVHNGVLDEGINFIQKPFSIGDLTSKIREILDNQ
jgi:PAS domain S-box-containing protein